MQLWPALHAWGQFTHRWTFPFLPLLIYPHFPFYHFTLGSHEWHIVQIMLSLCPSHINLPWLFLNPPFALTVWRPGAFVPPLLPSLWGVKLLRWSPTKAEERESAVSFEYIHFWNLSQKSLSPPPTSRNVNSTFKWMVTMSTLVVALWICKSIIAHHSVIRVAQALFSFVFCQSK